MALPTPLTAIQVDGSFDLAEIRVKFLEGEHRGLFLFVARDDANLGAAVNEGKVLVEDPSAFAIPTFGPASPLTFVTSPAQMITITGTGFTPDLFAEGTDSTDSGFSGDTVVTSTSLVFTFDLTLFAAGPGEIIVYDSGDNTLHVYPITINAAP